MVFRTLGLCLLLFSAVSYAQGRKPAVEDFVGIEIEEAQVTPQGTESLYNFEADLSKLEEKKKNPPAQIKAETIAPSKPWSKSTMFGISLIVGLPLLMWLMVMSHLKKKASVESASNIEVLEKYRKERERKAEESTRKVS
jgi:hypothetical protein